MAQHAEKMIVEFNISGKQALKTHLFQTKYKNQKQLAQFLFEQRAELNQIKLGEALGDPANIELLDHYTSLLNFDQEKNFHAAMKKFLEKGGFQLSGEAQVIDRFMAAFAKHYSQQHPHQALSANAHIIAFAALQLNTDLHNPQIKNAAKRQKNSFVEELTVILQEDLNKLMEAETTFQTLKTKFEPAQTTAADTQKTQLLQNRLNELNAKKNTDFQSLSLQEKEEIEKISAQLKEKKQYLKLKVEYASRVEALKAMNKHLKNDESILTLKKELATLYDNIQQFQFCLHANPQKQHLKEITLKIILNKILIQLSKLFPQKLTQDLLKKVLKIFSKKPSPTEASAPTEISPPAPKMQQAPILHRFNKLNQSKPTPTPYTIQTRSKTQLGSYFSAQHHRRSRRLK